MFITLWGSVGLFVVISALFFYYRKTYLAFFVPTVILFAIYFMVHGVTFADLVWAIIATVFFAVFGISALRTQLVTKRFFPWFKMLAPKISATEQVGIDCGTVWFDGELYSGRPRWKKFSQFEIKSLSAEEQHVLDHDVQTLCAAIDDEEITRTRQLPENFWALCKQYKLFGMHIPKEWGGLGLSTRAQSEVVMKIATRSITAAVTVMVPNSLGPAELILHYGTDYQKKTYLKRLADGDEIPCFALTEPHAGSDATSLRSSGVVCYKTIDGKEVLGINLNFEKRYITLAPVATLIGLAFHLYDPQHLLGEQENLGITCALLPRETEGVWIGNHHNPMNIPFPNGPIRGRDVFIPLSQVIGDRQGIGMGWRMLTECLAAGRSISLPALAGGALQVATASSASYASLRKQFGVPIGHMEGVAESLAHIAGLTYAVGALQMVTCSALDIKEKPSVLSGIVKCYATEFMRTGINHAMDIFGGHAICRGPNNIIAKIYEAIPVAITVEGANILTRSMIVYGQGILRCHPYLYNMMSAMKQGDVKAFDKTFFGYVSYFISNFVQWGFYRLGGWRFVKSPSYKKYYGGLSYASTFFALLSDICLLTFGGSIKTRERIIGRLADVMAWLYIGSSVLRRYEDDHDKSLEPVLAYVMGMTFAKIDEACASVIDNLPLPFVVRGALGLMKGKMKRFTYHRHDKNEQRMVASLLHEGDVRKHLSRGIYVPAGDEDGLGRLLETVEKNSRLLPVVERMRIELRKRHIKMRGEYLSKALELDIISSEEHAKLKEIEEDIELVIRVSDYTKEEYHQYVGVR